MSWHCHSRSKCHALKHVCDCVSIKIYKMLNARHINNIKWSKPLSNVRPLEQFLDLERPSSAEWMTMNVGLMHRSSSISSSQTPTSRKSSDNNNNNNHFWNDEKHEFCEITHWTLNIQIFSFKFTLRKWFVTIYGLVNYCSTGWLL